MSHSCASSTYFPLSNVPGVTKWFETNYLHTINDPITLVFTEAGHACAELTMAKQLIEHGLKCMSIIIMDRTYVGIISPCRALVHQIEQRGIQITLIGTYCSLVPQILTIRGKFAIIGLHQSHVFHNLQEVADYNMYIQACVAARCNGRLITPYLNIMDCSRLHFALAAHRHGLFKPMLNTVHEHTYINSTPWDEWYKWMASRKNLNKRVHDKD